MRGFICASMNKLPNDPQLLDLSGEELAFVYHYKKKYMHDIQTTLGTMLGTHWTPESVHSEPTSQSRNKDVTHMDTPLALLLNPKLGKWMKENTPKPRKQRLKSGEIEFEEVLGVNLIREHQRKLLNAAASMLNK